MSLYLTTLQKTNEFSISTSFCKRNIFRCSLLESSPTPLHVPFIPLPYGFSTGQEVTKGLRRGEAATTTRFFMTNPAFSITPSTSIASPQTHMLCEYYPNLYAKSELGIGCFSPSSFLITGPGARRVFWIRKMHLASTVCNIR